MGVARPGIERLVEVLIAHAFANEFQNVGDRAENRLVHAFGLDLDGFDLHLLAYSKFLYPY